MWITLTVLALVWELLYFIFNTPSQFHWWYLGLFMTAFILTYSFGLWLHLRKL